MNFEQEKKALVIIFRTPHWPWDYIAFKKCHFYF